MRDREFGVELEFSSNGHKSFGVGDTLYESGFEDWVGTRYERYYHSIGSYRNGYRNIGQDGSELEIRSPILQGRKGFKELKTVLNILNSMGCYTTTMDGLHVHHNAPEFEDNKELVTKLLKSWFNNQDEISKMITPRRVIADSPCPSIRQEHINFFEDSNSHLSSAIHQNLPRGNINLQSLPEHGSIEIRYMEGTLNWDIIESWIRFGQSLLNGVTKRKNPIVKTGSPVILMNRLKTSSKAKTILSEKVMQYHTIY